MVITGAPPVKYSVVRPIIMPPTAPEITAHHTFVLTPVPSTTKKATAMKATVAPMVPARRATSGFLSAKF